MKTKDIYIAEFSPQETKVCSALNHLKTSFRTRYNYGHKYLVAAQCYHVNLDTMTIKLFRLCLDKEANKWNVIYEKP